MRIVHRQKIDFTIASGQASGSATLSGFSTLAKMVPLFLSHRIADIATGVSSGDVDVDVDITSTTNITFTRGNTTSAAITGTIYVFEFGADTTVQKATWSMNSSSIVDTVSISAVTLANTFMVHYRKTSESGGQESFPDGRLTGCWFSSTTQVRIERDATESYSCDGHIFIISSSTLTVEHGSLNTTSSSTTITDTITSVTLAETFLISSYFINTSSGFYNDEGVFAADIQNSTTVRWRRSYSQSCTMDFKYMIVSDSSFSVQRGEFNTTGTTDSDTISSVDISSASAKTGDGNSGCSSQDGFLSGNLDGRYWNVYLSGSTTVNGQTGDAATSLVVTWEVVEFVITSVKDFLHHATGRGLRAGVMNGVG